MRGKYRRCQDRRGKDREGNKVKIRRGKDRGGVEEEQRKKGKKWKAEGG